MFQIKVDPVEDKEKSPEKSETEETENNDEDSISFGGHSILEGTSSSFKEEDNENGDNDEDDDDGYVYSLKNKKENLQKLRPGKCLKNLLKNL